jgi:hypothetical protein
MWPPPADGLAAYRAWFGGNSAPSHLLAWLKNPRLTAVPHLVLPALLVLLACLLLSPSPAFPPMTATTFHLPWPSDAIKLDNEVLGDAGLNEVLVDSEIIRRELWIDASVAAEAIQHAPQSAPPGEPELIQQQPHPAAEPPPKLIHSEPQLEEPAMIVFKPNTWVAIAIGWLLTAPSALAAAEEPPKQPAPGEIADTLTKINRKLDDLPGMKAKLDALENRLVELEKVPVQIENGTKAVKANNDEVKALRQEVASLKEGLGQLQADLRKLQALVDAVEKHKAFSPPSPPADGQIELINAWNSPVMVVIDRDFYRLDPGARRVVTRPAGEFSYEVLGIQGLVTRKLASGKTFTIRIGPQ